MDYNENSMKDFFYSQTNPHPNFLSDDTEKVAIAGFPVRSVPTLLHMIGAGPYKEQEEADKERIRNIRPSRSRKAEKAMKLSGNYYSQAQNLVKNLRVIFTPISAIYVIKNGAKDVAIETVDVDKMDAMMRSAWERKDQTFFINMMVNKMMSDIHLAERMFVKQGIQNQTLINGAVAKQQGLHKRASVSDDNSMMGYLNSVLKMRTFYENSAESEKIADILLDMMGDKEVNVVLGFDGEAEKYAALGKIDKTFGLNSSTSSMRSLKSRLESPGYLAKHLDVVFLPDRVSFVVDNTLIGTLPALDMNIDSFQAFQKHDKRHFQKIFRKEVKHPPKGGIKKTAAARLGNKTVPIASAFRAASIQPKIYDLILSKQYGDDWNTNDLPVLIKRIELDFGLGTKGIADIPLNKIMSIYTLLSEDTVNAYSSSFAFEKNIRSFNNLPVDFLLNETDGLGINEVLFGLDVYDEVMKHRGVNIYEVLSDEIIQYLTDLLLDKDLSVVFPNDSDMSEKKEEFFATLNRQILNGLEQKNRLSMLEDDSEAFAHTLQQNEILQPLTIDVLQAVRSGEIDAKLTDEYIKRICARYQFDNSKSSLLRRQVAMNLEADKFIADNRDMLSAQMKMYSL